MAASSENVEVARGADGRKWVTRRRRPMRKGNSRKRKLCRSFSPSGPKPLRMRTSPALVAHHGKLSPKCFSAYYNYGCALLRNTQSNQDSVKGATTQSDTLIPQDLDLAWKMLHVARAISEKSPGSTMKKYLSFVALTEVSVQREDLDYTLIACFKALAILEHLLEPDYRHIINLNGHIRFAFELVSKFGDAKAISMCKSLIENLKRANEALLAYKGDDPSATEVGPEKSSLAKDIEFSTDILPRC
ncbi:uncharacterized protein LOC119310322 [Triticum dicoccoides]|uniref:uncharacterized protein LOC119310322 n=1 Tax=Triticum dicoccoides TaxID=85692 RepID=UPI00189159B8|nr:uncharacterized protein LOC119310322 [Triticum dicoccoides]